MLSLIFSLVIMPVFAEDFEGTVIVNGIEYSTLADAIQKNADITEPVTMEINGTVSWKTGAAHGSTPFEMATTQLTLKAVDENSTFIATGVGVGAIGMDNGTVIYQNLTVIDESAYQYENGENAWEFTYLEFRGNSIFENVKFDDGILMNGESANFVNCTFSGHNNDSSDLGNVTMYGVWIANGSAEFRDCTFTGTRGLKTHEAYKTEVSQIIVDNCVFDNLSEKPGVAIGSLNSDTVVTIKNSKFINCQGGDQGQYIYESDTPVESFQFNLTDNLICNGQMALMFLQCNMF